MRFSRNFLKSGPLFSILFMIMAGCTARLGGYPLLPAFFLIPVYYWLVFRPDWLSIWSLFGIGLFYDSLMGHELGISSVLLMLSSFLGQYVRPLLTSYHFLFIWGTFGLYSLGYLIIFGFFVSAGLPFFVSWIYGIVMYPFVAWVLGHLHLRLQSYV